MALEQVEETRGRACGTRLSGSPPPEWMCTGTPARGGDRERALEQAVAHGLGVRARLAEAVLAPAHECPAGIGRARLRDVEPRAVGDHRLEGHRALGRGRLEARDERVLQLVVAARAVAILGDPRLDADDAVDGDAGLARELGGGDDRQREALVDDEALDPRVAPEPLQVAGRIRAQALEPGRAHRLVRGLAAEVLGEAGEQRERERRGRRRPLAARRSSSRDRRRRSGRTSRASSRARRSPRPGRPAAPACASRAGGCR